MRLRDTTQIPSDDTQDYDEPAPLKNTHEGDDDFGSGENTHTPAADFPSTDLERSILLHEELDGDARFVPEWKQWFTWNGETWNGDLSEINDRVKTLVFQLKERAYEVEEPKERALTVIKALQSGSKTAIDAMLALCSRSSDIRVDSNFFDSSPMILGVANGAIDLTTGNFRAATKEDFILKRSPVVYDPTAVCPLWEAFLAEILPHKELVSFIQRAIGYSLTGLTSEQIMFFLYGGGQNGKSTFIQTILSLMGVRSYAWKTSASLFLATKHADEGSLNMLSQLPGMRFVVGAEVDQGARLAESRIKDLTGGDEINACKKFCEAFNFHPTHKLWLYGNHKPTIRGTDDGIWRRMCLIPFEVQIPEAKKDPMFPSKLAQELPGILNWAIKGCLEWQKKGLQVPAIVKDAVKEYREEEDTVGDFIAAECLVKPGEKVLRNKLYIAYKLWCSDQGFDYPQGPKPFADRVKKTGAVGGGANSGSTRSWKGISLKDPASFVERR